MNVQFEINYPKDGKDGQYTRLVELPFPVLKGIELYLKGVTDIVQVDSSVWEEENKRFYAVISPANSLIKWDFSVGDLDELLFAGWIWSEQ